MSQSNLVLDNNLSVLNNLPCDVFSLIKNAYSLAPTHSHTPQNDDLSNYLLVVAYNKSIWKKRSTCNEIIYIYILPNDV